MKIYFLIPFLLFCSPRLWSQSYDPLSSYQKNSILLKQDLVKDIVVAVIDTGIDLDHPDLKDNVLRNEIECDAGLPQNGKIEDRDRNGFPGDCLGWNFVPNESSPDTKPEDIPNSETLQLPTDREGHGTHVAGIIGAVRNNNLGLSNASNRIKILPLKAFQKTFQPASQFRIKFDNKVNNANRTVILFQAIDYAIKRKVDIINFSIGWNKNIDSPTLRSKIAEAQKKGIIIVAAAGNDSSEVTTFPCLYENVLCVGASNNHNTLLDMSNRGNGVDLFAPGDDILSTFPLNASFNNFLNGYDYYSGTSQAAPYVSKVLALLKGLAPEKDAVNLVYLLQSTTSQMFAPFLQNSVINSGIINPSAAIDTLMNRAPLTNYVITSFKSLLQSTLDDQHRATLSIPIKILSQLPSDFTFTLTPQEKSIVVQNPRWQFSSTDNLHEKNVDFSIHVTDLLVAQKQFFTLTITDNNHLNQEYHFATRFYRSDLTPQKILPFEFETHQPYLTNRGNEKGTPLENIKNLYGKPTNFFYVSFFEKAEESTRLRLTLHELQPHAFKEISVNTFNDILRMYALLPIDLNFDKVNEYLLITESVQKIESENQKIENKRFVKVYYLDQNLKPIYADLPFLRYDIIFPVYNDNINMRTPLYPLGNISVIPMSLGDKILPQIIAFQDLAVLDNYHKIKKQFLAQSGLGPDIFFFNPTLDKKTQSVSYQVHSLSSQLNQEKWSTLITPKEFYKISNYVSLCKDCKKLNFAVVYTKGKLGTIRTFDGMNFSDTPEIVDIERFTKKFDPASQKLLGLVTYPNKKIYIHNFTDNMQWNAILPHPGPWRALTLRYIQENSQYQVVLNDDSQIVHITSQSKNTTKVTSISFDKYFGTTWSSTGDLFDITNNIILLEGFKLSDMGITLIPLTGENLALTIERSLYRKAQCLPLGLFSVENSNATNLFQLCQDSSQIFTLEQY